MAEFCYRENAGNFDLDFVNGAIEALCQKRGFGRQKLYTVRLVVEELVTNAQKYGSRGYTGETVEVRFKIEKGKAFLTIRDNLGEFNPLDMADPDVSLHAGERGAGGLGLFLVKKRVSSLRYEYAGDCNIINVII